jgi:hypothetical protein
MIMTIIQKRITAESQRTQRINFIRIPERGILINDISTWEMHCLCPKDFDHSIFHPLRGKYYKKELSVLCALRERSERAVNYQFYKHG